MDSEAQRGDETGPERVQRQDNARWAVTAREGQVVQVQRVGVDRVDEGEGGAGAGAKRHGICRRRACWQD